MKLVSLDTSVIVCILLKEDGYQRYERFLLENGARISSLAVVEAYLILAARLTFDVRDSIDVFLDTFGVQVVDFTARHIHTAQDAFEAYGKGRHPARLNFGDCVVYATAKLSDTPLLFLGDDFAQTDLDIVKLS